MTHSTLLTALFSLFMIVCIGQDKPREWTAYNREADFGGDVIHLNAMEGSGVLWLNDRNFLNGTIELDIKGRDLQGESFVGVAFHGQDDAHYDAVYFRPFNFRNPERNQHSVQYIAMPDYEWKTLRETKPGIYENTIDPVPDPEGWFHARIEIEFPQVKVYVNGATTPSLEVEQISLKGHGKIGLWAGHNSEGWYKNLQVTPRGEGEPSTVLMDVGHKPIFWGDPFAMAKDDEKLPRVQSMTYELVRTLSQNNACLAYAETLTEPVLDEADAVFIHIPSATYTPSEAMAMQRYLKNGGSLFLVMDSDYWSTLDQTQVNDLIAPFDVAFKGMIPDSLAGGHTTQNRITQEPLKISYHGGRIVEGGTPFAFRDEGDTYPFGVYARLENGGKLVVMGDGMTSLYMTSWQGVEDYQCQEFMQAVFGWLLSKDKEGTGM